jgi:hypothetical protein
LVIGSAILIAAILLISTLSLIWFTRPTRVSAGPATAIVNVIRVPTDTPIPPTPTPVPGITPSPTIPPGQPGGEITVGAFVQITGTGGDGLRLRADPGLDGEVRFLALESEMFQVMDGPRQDGDYSWWFLVAPYDEKVKGWAVANYLTIVQNP